MNADVFLPPQTLAALANAVAWACTLSPRAERLGREDGADGHGRTLSAEEVGNTLDVSKHPPTHPRIVFVRSRAHASLVLFLFWRS